MADCRSAAGLVASVGLKMLLGPFSSGGGGGGGGVGYERITQLTLTDH